MVSTKSLTGKENDPDAGMHQDVHIQDIGDDDDGNGENNTLNKTQPIADIKHFFKKAPRISGSTKGRVLCVCCR
jgi:hypothetical protein